MVRSASQIAAGFRLRGAVGEQHSLFRDARQPDLLLLRSGADRDRIAAQERRQHGRGDAQIDARHFFADAIHIEGSAAHAPELFGDEQELNAQLVRTAHVTNDFQRTLVLVIELSEHFVRQAFLGEVLERLQTEFQSFTCDHGRFLSLLCGAAHFTNFVG